MYNVFVCVYTVKLGVLTQKAQKESMMSRPNISVFQKLAIVAKQIDRMKTR